MQQSGGLGSDVADKHLCRYGPTVVEAHNSTIEYDLNTRLPIAQIAEIFERVPWFGTGLFLCFKGTAQRRHKDFTPYATAVEKLLYKGSILSLNTTQTVHPGCYRNWINVTSLMDLSHYAERGYDITPHATKTIVDTTHLMAINTDLTCKRHTHWKEVKTKTKKQGTHKKKIRRKNTESKHTHKTSTVRNNTQSRTRHTSASEHTDEEDTSSQSVLPSSTEPSRGNTPIRESRAQMQRRMRRQRLKQDKAKVSTSTPTVEMLAKKLEQMEMMMQQRTTLFAQSGSTPAPTVSTAPLLSQHHIPQSAISSTSTSAMSTPSLQQHTYPQHQNALRNQQYQSMPSHLPMQPPMHTHDSSQQPL